MAVASMDSQVLTWKQNPKQALSDSAPEYCFGKLFVVGLGKQHIEQMGCCPGPMEDNSIEEARSHW